MPRPPRSTAQHAAVAALVAALLAVALFVSSYRLGSATAATISGAVADGAGWATRHWQWVASAAGVLLVVGLASRASGRTPARDRMPMPMIVHVFLVVLIGLTAFAVSAAAIWYGLGQPALPQENRLDTKSSVDLVKLGLTVAGGLGGVIALVVAYRRQLVTEQENRRAQEESERARIRDRRESTKFVTERFATACSLLGHEAAAVRLAGVYAVAALADDWEEQRQACIDVLCAYLRMPYEPDSRSPGFRQGEREVRLSITRVIRDHLRVDAAQSWYEQSFDFSGATFDCGDFSQIVVAGRMDFHGCRFVAGIVDFQDVSFGPGTLDLTGAVFSGGVLDLRRAGFRDTSLRGSVALDLRSARIGAGVVDLREAAFHGGLVDLRRIEFRGGVLDLRAPRSWVRPPRLDDYPPAGVPDGLRLPEPTPAGT